MNHDQIRKKIFDYKGQDIKRGMDKGNLRLQDVLEMSNAQGHACKFCGQIMNFVNVEKDPLNWSVDRVDNKRPHDAENCVLSCIQCNLSRGGFYKSLEHQ